MVGQALRAGVFAVLVGLFLGVAPDALSASAPPECVGPRVDCVASPPGTGEARIPAPPPVQEYAEGIPIEELSLYKTITYVIGTVLTDQIWYLLIASEAATTGPVFMVVNGSTSSMMTYAYEYAWRLCCEAPPDENGVVPISVTKAAIYRGLSILRVGGLALIFGNTIGSSALVTTAITVSRTTVYILNDMLWYEIDKRPPLDPGDASTVVSN